MSQSVFDPRSTEYKNPFGAVPVGNTVSVRVRPPRAMGVTGASIIIEHEQLAQKRELAMDWLTLKESSDEYGAEFSVPDEPGLVWYYFRFETGSGVQLYGKDGFAASPEPFLLTVYINNCTTPDWFSEAVVYQIFPDRFFRTRAADPASLGKSGWLHENWGDIPVWEPDPNGKITNLDFFGGDLAGICEKLPKLWSLGASVVYINPIFEAASNHRYDTGDYTRIDPMLGTEADFIRLCEEARKLGIRIMLDGVFSHTGDDSVYFNKYGRYDSLGAFQSKDSPYSEWYSFSEFPEKYDSWWGINTLPEVNETSGSYFDFIVRSDDSVVRRWLRKGASGWRLDVADELPDEFIAGVRTAAREEKEDAFILGEVWENAATKISYGLRRRYLWAGLLDGVMNYPFRTALIEYLLGGGAENFMDTMEELREAYPEKAFYSCMNFLSTHDTPRILTVLGASRSPGTRRERAEYRLSAGEYELGRKRLFAAAAVMFTFPGAPTVYYGDEAGMQGFEDPFNRGSYPWGNEDKEILSHFTYLARLRQKSDALKRGDIRYIMAKGNILAFSRNLGWDRVVTIVNAGSVEHKFTLDGKMHILPPVSVIILEE